MITWFQRVFGKHLKWVLMLVLIVLLVSFIFTIGAVPRANLNAQRHQPLMILGVDLRDRSQIEPIQRSADYTLTRLMGRSNLAPAELQILILGRMAMTQLADQWGLPEPTPQQFEDYLRTIPAFQKPDGSFDNAAYLRYRDEEVEAAPAATRNEIMAILTENARLEMVHRILGGPGYAPVFAAESQFLLGRAQYDIELATANFTTFEPDIPDNSAAIEKLFASNPQAFQIPPTARLSYVYFPAAKVADPTPAQLREYAAAHKEQFPGVTPDNLGDKTEAVTKSWREAQKQEAIRQAAVVAKKFAGEILELDKPRGDPAIAELLKKNNLTAQPLPIVTRGKPAPADSPVPDDVLQQIAFAMSEKTYFTPPVRLPDGVGVFLFEDSTPARSAKLEEVRDEVTKFYRQQEKQRQFIAHGTEWRNAILKAMADGKTFTEAATAQGLTVKDYPNTSYKGLSEAIMEAYTAKFAPAEGEKPALTGLAAMGTDVISALVQPSSKRVPFLLTLQPGDVTPMQPIPDYGLFVHVVKREVPKVPDDAADLQLAIKRWGEQESNANAGHTLGQLIIPAQDALTQADKEKLAGVASSPASQPTKVSLPCAACDGASAC